MQAWKWASALLLVALASPAPAASYAWCRMSGGNYESYLSAIVEIGEGREAYRAFLAGPFGAAFRDHVRAAFDPRAANLHCTREGSLLFANDHIAVLINANPGIKFVQTGWRGPRHAAAGAKRPGPEPAVKAVAAKPADSVPAKKPWELEYERKLAAYEQELARQRQAVRDYERGQAATAAMKAELRAKAEKAQAEWQAAVAACRAGDRSACRGSGQP